MPDPDAALFLCAIDHRTGYDGGHLVDGRGPFEGSELLWEAGLRSARSRPGLLTAAALADVSAEPRWPDAFEVDGETVADPERRAAMWRDLATGLQRDHSGHAGELLDAAGGRLGGPEGLLARLAAYEAYADPLAKKAQLFAKICARRGWLAVADPESWEVSADNVLMRLALRSGLVAPGGLDAVRAATRAAFKRVSRRHRDLAAGSRRHALGARSRRRGPARRRPPATSANRRATRTRPGTEAPLLRLAVRCPGDGEREAQQQHRAGDGYRALAESGVVDRIGEGAGEQDRDGERGEQAARGAHQSSGFSAKTTNQMQRATIAIASEISMIGSSGPRTRRCQPDSSSSSSRRSKTPVTRR